MDAKTKKEHSWKKHVTPHNILIAILVVLFAIELHSFLSDLRSTYESGQLYLNYRHSPHMMMHPPVPATPSAIQSWMTFGYINFVFKLPPSYLKGALSISSSQYPNMQLLRYARMSHSAPAQFLASVQQAVAAYKP